VLTPALLTSDTDPYLSPEFQPYPCNLLLTSVVLLLPLCLQSRAADPSLLINDTDPYLSPAELRQLAAGSWQLAATNCLLQLPS
jgi:hypothetical protein